MINKLSNMKSLKNLSFTYNIYDNPVFDYNFKIYIADTLNKLSLIDFPESFIYNNLEGKYYGIKNFTNNNKLNDNLLIQINNLFPNLSKLKILGSSKQILGYECGKEMILSNPFKKLKIFKLQNDNKYNSYIFDESWNINKLHFNSCNCKINICSNINILVYRTSFDENLKLKYNNIKKVRILKLITTHISFYDFDDNLFLPKITKWI